MSFAVIAAIAGLVLTTPSTSRAQSEDEIKAAFLLNFARYVEWPQAAFPSAHAPIRFCTIGDAAFGSVISETIEGKSVEHRELEHALLDLQDMESATACHILYVGSSGSAAAAATVKRPAETNAFTIAGDEGFAKRGGVANFYRAGNKIRFEINPEAARKAGLKISSRLLRLARIVE